MLCRKVRARACAPSTGYVFITRPARREASPPPNPSPSRGRAPRGGFGWCDAAQLVGSLGFPRRQGIVLAAVDFHDQAGLVAHKVGDVAADRHLAAELATP